MRCWWTRAGAVALGIAAAGLAPAVRADDDIVAAPEAFQPDRQPPAAMIDNAGGPPGIDLATHVDLNVCLPPTQWRLSSAQRGINVGFLRGPIVMQGQLSISNAPLPEAPERIRRADEGVMVRLRQAQRDRLAAVGADREIPADRRRALELATEVDIRRVMANVAALRSRYEGRRANLGDDDWKAFQKDVQLCRRAIADPFGADSLFAEVQAGLEPAP